MDIFESKLNTVGGSVEPSKTLAVAALAKRLKSEGKDIVSLTAGEPDFKTPEHVSRAGIDAIEQGATRYTAAAGEPELRRAVADLYAKRWNLPLEPENVCVSSGAKPLLYYIMAILLEKDDEVLFPVPYWVSYEAMVNMCRGKAVPVRTTLDNGHKLTAAALDRACTPKSKILLLNNPTNPTGAVYDSTELLAIAEVAREHDLIIIADEIYEDLVYGGRHQPLYNLTDWLPERTIAVSGVSKSFAMTGWRIGYAIAAKSIIKTLANFQSQALSSPCQISQRAALAGLTGDRRAIEEMRSAFGERLDYCLERMGRLGLPYVEPRGAFYIFFDTSRVCERKGWAHGQEFCTHLLEEKGVALVPGDAFGMPNWARISFAASPEDLERAFDRLEAFLA